jgi:diacylglycerol kinase (ATP)
MSERREPGIPASSERGPTELPGRWTAVINPAAGRGRGRTQLPHIADALALVDADVHIEVSADLDDAARIATAAYDDHRGVVACGGDGLVCQLAGLAAVHDGVLAIVPAGSGNDFARHLGIPRDDPVSAAELLRTGRVERVDLCRAETADGTSAWSTTVANAGFDAEANRWANTVDWAGGTPLYVLATLRTLASYRPRPVRVRVDDDVLETEAWLVAVGNSRSYAGGMMITPDAALDDGALDVCVVGRVSRADFLRTFPRVFDGTHTRNPRVTMCRGTRVVIEMPEALDGAELWASGERVGPLPARLEAVPRALRVVIP